MKMLFRLLTLLSALTLTQLSHAQAKAEAEAEEGGKDEGAAVTYVELAPAFVTNFQAPKIRYLKTDITLKVKGSATADAINRHVPYIRNNLVMLFSRQSEESLNSPEGRQHLKEEALQEIISVLQTESEPVDVQEVLFTSFIVD